MIFVKFHVRARGRNPHDAEPQAVRTVSGDQVQRIGRIPQRFGHLAPLFVADDAGEIDVFKWHLTHPFIAGHDHAGDPEEDNVRAGYQIRSRVECLQGVRLFRPAHRGKWPEPGTEPRVEDIGVLLPGRIFGRIRGVHSAVDLAGLPVIPHWNPVSPPQLPRDAPVLNALQPVIVNLRPAIWVKLHFTLRHHCLGGGHAGIFQEPLFTEARFDRHSGAFAVADRVLIWLRLHQSACGLHEFRGFLPGRESFQSDQVRASLGRHFAVGGEHIDDRESMTLADFEVRLVVRGSHFQNAGAKFEIHMLVSDDGDQALLAWLLKRQRTQDHLANQMGVARIFRIHRHRRIGRNCFRSRRGNGQERAGLFGEFHLEIIHETILRSRVHLLIG